MLIKIRKNLENNFLLNLLLVIGDCFIKTEIIGSVYENFYQNLY